jgi:hypothetical protein
MILENTMRENIFKYDRLMSYLGWYSNHKLKKGECSWPGNNQLMQLYHDKEWCLPTTDDQYIVEMLTLEGAQAVLLYASYWYGG